MRGRVVEEPGEGVADACNTEEGVLMICPPQALLFP